MERRDFLGVAALSSLAVLPSIGVEVDQEHPEWTVDPPIEPGLYWYAIIDSQNSTPRSVEVTEFMGRMCVGCRPIVEFKRVWAGPLREPVGHARLENWCEVGS